MVAVSVLGIIIILISYLLIMQKGRRNYFKPSFFFLVFYTVFYLVGVLILNFNYFTRPGDTLFFRFNFIPFSYLLVFALGTWAAGKIKHMNKTKLQEYLHNKDVFTPRDCTPFYLVAFLGFFIAFFLGVLYFGAGIPLFATDRALSRVSSIRGGGYFFIGISLLMPLFCLLGYFCATIRNERAPKLIYTILVIVTMILMVFTLFKSPLLRFVLIFITFHFVLRKGEPKKSHIVVLSAFFICSIILFSYLTSADFAKAAQYSFHRVFTMNSQHLFRIFQIFPEEHSFMLGKATLMDISCIKPGPDISFNGLMYQIIYPTMPPGGINSSVGEFWAEVGYGYLLIGFVWGFALEMFFIRFVTKREKNLADYVFYAFYTFGLGNTAGGVVPKLIEFVLPLLVAHLLFKIGLAILSSPARSDDCKFSIA